MIKYHVTGNFFTVNSGKVTLTQAQAKDRQHALKSVGKDIYEVIAPIGFKCGEIFGFDGEPSKAVHDLIKTEEQMLEAEIESEEAAKAENSEKAEKAEAKSGSKKVK